VDTRTRNRSNLRIAREKQVSREADARALASGRTTREQLTRENGFLPAERAIVDLRRVPILR
jgi:hypothetical protein